MSGLEDRIPRPAGDGYLVAGAGIAPAVFEVMSLASLFCSIPASVSPVGIEPTLIRLRRAGDYPLPTERKMILGVVGVLL